MAKPNLKSVPDTDEESTVEPEASGAELFAKAAKRYEDGTANVQTALVDVAAAWAVMRQSIMDKNGGVLPLTNKMAAALKSALAPVEVNLSTKCRSWLENSSDRSALEWMASSQASVKWVFENSNASVPKSVKQAWDNRVKCVVKEGFENDDPAQDVASGLANVTADEVEKAYGELRRKAAAPQRYGFTKAELKGDFELLAEIKAMIAEIEKETATEKTDEEK